MFNYKSDTSIIYTLNLLIKLLDETSDLVALIGDIWTSLTIPKCIEQCVKKAKQHCIDREVTRCQLIFSFQEQTFLFSWCHTTILGYWQTIPLSIIYILRKKHLSLTVWQIIVSRFQQFLTCSIRKTIFTNYTSSLIVQKWKYLWDFKSRKTKSS